MVVVNTCDANASTNKIGINRNLNLLGGCPSDQNKEKARNVIDIDKPARILIMKNSKKKTVNANAKIGATNLVKSLLCFWHRDTAPLKFFEKLCIAAAKQVSDKNKIANRNSS